MKKFKVLSLITALTLTFCAGCGNAAEPATTTRDTSSSVADESDEEEDWREWSDFHKFKWETPDSYENLYLTIYEEDDEITVVYDTDAYLEMCTLDIGGICDEETIWESMVMADVDEDGYDDLLLSDYNEGIYYDYVFLYNTNIDEFELDEELSNLEGYTGEPNGSSYESTAYEEAYAPLLDEIQRQNSFCNYYLFNINDDYDDVYELIVEVGDDRTFEVYTVGLDDELGWYPVYIGDLASSADYAYVTMDAIDGDDYDGLLTLNVCVQGVRWLYAYTLDNDYNLYEELVYEVEEPDEYEVDGIMLDRYDINDWEPLTEIDIQY